ncbi:MAG: PVC-type heme-binding CxxCH protein, partial [Planctomycetia bacterium]
GMKRRTTTACILFIAAAGFAASADEPFLTPNNQAELTPLLKPADALAKVTAPPGFQTTLFASEPDVQQPIGIAFDDRGRLWVAENYTYSDRVANFDMTLRDRIVILEDSDGDGRSDKRTVFWDQGKKLTSVEIGFGGVWALCAPELLFIPDANHDDKPDGPPVVVLDGWDDGPIRHNIVNGLRWGPDGWLYGRHGIQAVSRIGPPDATPEQRTPINVGMWRYHPQTKRFEVVCHGTTNPWGHDWDEFGQLYFINTVIGHLWHVVPGAHYRRMYGEDLNPHAYQLIEQTADHFHWDVGNETWHDIVKKGGVTDGTDRAGGGHAHSGLMIYLGDDWPDEYRGDVFTLNFHGRRINRDHPERLGATYTAKHRPDMVKFGDEWFRGLDLAYGPDGGVYVADWSDVGECHDHDGVHRTSGRIYKIIHAPVGAKKPAAPKIDVTQLKDAGLVRLHHHKNDFHPRHARRLLQERFAAGGDVTDVRDALLKIVLGDGPVVPRLRSLWSLHATGGAGEQTLAALLDDPEEHVRTWAVQLLTDGDAPTPTAVDALARRAEKEESGLVLTFLASALRKIPADRRFAVAAAIGRHAEYADDRVLPLMLWYGVEAAVPVEPLKAVGFIESVKMPLVARFVARRLTTDVETAPLPVDQLARLLTKPEVAPLAEPILAGMVDALRGWRKAPAPESWPKTTAYLESTGAKAALGLMRELSVVFGDGRALDEVRKIAADAAQSTPSRRQAIRSLANARAPDLDKLFVPLLTDRDLGDEAVRGLAGVDLAKNAPLLVAAFPKMGKPARDAAVEALASRPDAAALLIDAVAKGVVPRPDVSAFVLRQMQLSGGEELQKRILELFPQQRLIGGDKLKLAAKYKTLIEGRPTDAIAVARGKLVYDQSCGKCHKLFGQGGAVGPELTGAQRGSPVYWLENILEPSAVVAVNFRMSVVALDDGRVLNGGL